MTTINQQPPAAGEAAYTPVNFTNWRVLPGSAIWGGSDEMVLLVADQPDQVGTRFFTVIAQQPVIFRGALEFIVLACNSFESMRQENARAHESYEGMNHAHQQLSDTHSKLLESHAALLKLAKSYLAALNSSDSDHDDFLDSGADTVDLLWTHDPKDVAATIEIAEAL